MNAFYYTMSADGSEAGPFSHAQMVTALHQGVIRRESLVRRADLAEFFAVDSYPEFTQVATAPVRAVPRVAVAVAAAAARPKAVAAAKPAMEGGTKAFIWAMVLLWGGLFVWGSVWAWGKWQQSSEEKARAVAEKWRMDNLPEFRAVNLKKRVEKILTDRSVEIAVDGEMEETESKRHPEFGRAERSEVWVRLAFSTDLQGEIGLVNFEPQWVRVRDGKGSFTTYQVVEGEPALRLVTLWDKLKVEGRIKYEK